MLTDNFDVWGGVDALQRQHLEVGVESRNAMGIDAPKVRKSEDLSRGGGIFFGYAEMDKYLF